MGNARTQHKMRLFSLFSLWLVTLTSPFVLEAPRNGSVSYRQSWQFLARDVPTNAALCVNLEKFGAIEGVQKMQNGYEKIV